MPTLSKANQRARESQNEARRRKEVALADMREMEAEELRKTLLPASDVRRVWGERLSALKDRFLALPDRLGARLVGQPEPDIRKILRTEIEECLRGAYADS
jgi:hypothetical protein